jgi:hypothetical protein
MPTLFSHLSSQIYIYIYIKQENGGERTSTAKITFQFIIYLLDMTEIKREGAKKIHNLGD